VLEPPPSRPNTPRTANDWCAVAATLDRRGKKREAIAAYRKAITLSPGQAHIYNNLGAILQEQGEFSEAVVILTRAIDLDPNFAAAHANLGSVLMRMGRQREAIPHLRRAVELRSDNAVAHAQLGAALLTAGEPQAALAPLKRAVALDPRLAQAHCILGEALRHLGALNESIDAFDRAIARAPDFAAAHANRGAALHQAGRLGEAVEACRRAIAADPKLADAHNNLGSALRLLGKMTEAVEAYRAAIAARPGFADAYANLAGTLKDLGRHDEAVATYRKVLDLDPGHVEADSALLMAVHYHPGWSREAIFAEIKRWNAIHVAPIAARYPRPALTKRSDGRIRVGMISGGFMRHPVGYLTVGAIENIDRNAFDVVLYTDSPREDDLTGRLRAAADGWVPIFAMSNAAVTERIRQDRIDILIDLNDGDASRRLVCAYRPAPVQVKWVGGLIDTTGMEVIDYILSDPIETPPGDDRWYVEPVARLPDGYVSYDPPDYAPLVGPLPALANGHVTFGCFNNFAKVNDGVVDLWCALMRRLDGSRLILQAKPLGDPSLRARLIEAFEQRGVRRERVELRGRLANAEVLATYNRIDIALDPFPYSGGLTTCEALWMGVPVVTLPGPTFAGRHCASHLTNVGLADWIVADRDAYVETAVSWASDLPRLARLRASLRDQVRRSPLCDHPRFARNLETAFRRMLADLPAPPPTGAHG
jgi:predicted O-linked N-acetylglucosamine transferase (SPINDLY family)